LPVGVNGSSAKTFQHAMVAFYSSVSYTCYYTSLPRSASHQRDTGLADSAMAADDQQTRETSMAIEARYRRSSKYAAKATAKSTKRVIGQVCNDPFANYTTTIPIEYGTQPRAECGPPSPADEAAAMNKAKAQFKQIAADYCKEGKCDTREFCAATVTNLVAENQGVVSTAAPNNQVRCAIKFKVSGNISCTCAAEPA
jgi:hypothetical protein